MDWLIISLMTYDWRYNPAYDVWVNTDNIYQWVDPEEYHPANREAEKLSNWLDNLTIG